MSQKPKPNQEVPKSDEKKKLSKQQLEKLRDQKMKFYEEQLPALRVEAEYHQLTAQIHEGMYRTQLAKVKHAELMSEVKQTPSKD